MKNRVGFLAGIFLFCLIAVSCSENFSPKTEFEEEYVLYCILNADTTFQTAYLSRSYNVNGFDPYENRNDPVIQNAVIRLKGWRTGETFEFSPDSTVRNDVSRYTTPMKFYSLNNFNTNYGDSVEIEAVLANGKVLKSITKVPPINYLFFNEKPFIYNPSSSYGNQLPGLMFKWRYIISGIDPESTYFMPRLELCYTKADNPGKLIRVKMPIRYLMNSQGYLDPIYPGVLNKYEIYYGLEAIEQLLKDISKGDPNKENYTIYYIDFSLLSMDKMLASSVSLQEVFEGEFSMRLGMPEFDNIENGLGVFGVYGILKTRVFPSGAFVGKFGYKVWINN